MEQLVYFDSLTKLHNRNFYEKQERLLNTLYDKPIGIIICDLDNLKYINDSFGHILTTAEYFFFYKKESIPASYQKLFYPDTKPADWPADVPDMETLLRQLDEQLERIQAIDAKAFDEPLPKKLFGNETKGELAAFSAFHEAMHVGQIQIMKRLIESTK